MRSRRGAAASIALAIVFFSFSAGFLTGRLTAGETFTVTAQYSQTTGLAPASATDGRAVQNAAAAGKEPSELPASAGSGDPVNINIADAEALMTLPNIGASRAQNIIAYREENGPFRSIADLMQVSGIGEAIYEKLKDKVTTGEPQ